MDSLVEAVGWHWDAGSGRNAVGSGSPSCTGANHSVGERFGRGEEASDDSKGGSDAATLACRGFSGLYECGKVDLDEPIDPLGSGGRRSSLCNVGSNDTAVSDAERSAGAFRRYGGILKETSDSSCGIFSVDFGGGSFCRCFDSRGGCESSSAGTAEESSR